MDWKKEKDLDTRHTGATIYRADGYKVWKGKYRVCYSIYSSDEWHLQRESDGKVLHSAKTAKACMESV